jgi:serine/threonine protein kinase
LTQTHYLILNFYCLCNSHIKLSILRTLHSGSFSRIYLCKNTDSNSNDENSFVAIKEIDTADLSVSQIKSIRYEMNILSQLQRHENIIRLDSIFTYHRFMYMVRRTFFLVFKTTFLRILKELSSCFP